MITEIRARRAPWSDSIEIVIINRDGMGDTYAGLPVVMEKVSSNREISPAMSLEYDHAQRLMDELWLCGLRPTEGTGSAGSLAATEKHLADMRVIVFNRLGISEKKP